MGVTRRVGEWIFGIKPGSTSISPDRQTVYSFDLEGRPLSWYDSGRVFKRSLASRVHGRSRVGGCRQYCELSVDEARRSFEGLRKRLSRAPMERLDSAVKERLDEIMRWSPEALLAERERFDAAYEPVNILPPDQYLAIVLQATFGCTWNDCTFCDFYQSQPFSARPTESFSTHARAVRSLLGRGAELRKRIFLASGNALILDNRRLRPILEIARGIFPGRGVSGFVDVFGGERKSAADWTDLRELGLDRVHVGLETGHDPLLRWLNKPAVAGDSIEFVSTLKRSRLAVAVIVMVGVGGKRFAADHVEGTLSLVARLPLEARDIVYLSPFMEHPDSTYALRAADDGARTLAAVEHESQFAELRDGIRRLQPSVRVSRYDIREFVY